MRRQRNRYSIIHQLQSAGITPVEVKRKERGYVVRNLDDIVSFMQETVKDPSAFEMDAQEFQLTLHSAGLGDPVAQDKLKAVIKRILHEQRLHSNPHPLLEDMPLHEAVFAMMAGAMFIEDLYKNPDIEEVQVNDRNIYIMRDGVSVKHKRTFESTRQVIQLQERLALYGQARISEQNPICSTYMLNQSRLTMTQPRYSAFPTIAIRNFILRNPSLATLISKGTINHPMAQALEIFVRRHLSIIVAGGTKAGKTTTLFALAREVPVIERLLTLETEMEMWLNHLFPDRNIIPFQSVPELGITMSEAFKPLLRLSPDRLMIGEVRGAEIAQGIQAALRGHDVMLSVHTKFRHMLIPDLMDMVMQDGQSHDNKMLELRIASAFNIIVYQRFIPINALQKRRVITEISQMYPTEGGQVKIEPLFLWDNKAKNWLRTPNRLYHGLIDHMEQSGLTEEELDVLLSQERAALC